jgi:hypothetical protein
MSNQISLYTLRSLIENALISKDYALAEFRLKEGLSLVDADPMSVDAFVKAAQDMIWEAKLSTAADRQVFNKPTYTNLLATARRKMGLVP